MPSAHTIDPEFELPASVAEVVALYARTVYDVRHFAHGSYTVGDAPLVSFPLLSQVPPDPHRFPLAHWHDGAIALRFTADMRGELVEPDRRSSLDELIASGRATPIDGAFTVALAPGDSAVIGFEDVRFELRCVPAARPPAYSSGFRWDWWPHALAMFVLLGALLLLARHRPADVDALRDNDVGVTSKVVGEAHSSYEPTARVTVRDRIRLAPQRRSAQGRASEIGERGRLGAPLAEPRERRFAVARKDPPHERLARTFDPAIGPVAGVRLGRMEAHFGHFLSSPDAAPDRASGPAQRDRWGARGPHPKHAHGLGGLADEHSARAAAGLEYAGAPGNVGDRSDVDPRRVRAGRVWRDLGVIGPLRLADVRRIVGWRSSALRRCGELGDASLRFTINGAGLVTNLVVTPASPRETRAARCVARKLQRMWFPRGVGSLHVRYPLPRPLPAWRLPPT